MIYLQAVTKHKNLNAEGSYKAQKSECGGVSATWQETARMTEREGIEIDPGIHPSMAMGRRSESSLNNNR